MEYFYFFGSMTEKLLQPDVVYMCIVSLRSYSMS